MLEGFEKITSIIDYKTEDQKKEFLLKNVKDFEENLKDNVEYRARENFISTHQIPELFRLFLGGVKLVKKEIFETFKNEKTESKKLMVDECLSLFWVFVDIYFTLDKLKNDDPENDVLENNAPETYDKLYEIGYLKGYPVLEHPRILKEMFILFLYLNETTLKKSLRRKNLKINRFL